METLPIKLELRKLGLTEREVIVYLTGLELGPTSVQNIAKTADIPRATTYEIIKRLEKRGLFTEIREDKKRYFVAESPDKILGILRIKKREIEEKEREFIRIIAALEARYSKERGEIKIYKGKEGLKVLEETFSFTHYSEILVLSSKITKKELKKQEEIYEKIKKRLGELRVKEIYSQKLKIKSKMPEVERKFSPTLDLKGTLILFDSAIFINPKKQEGFLIENPLVVYLLRALFMALWGLL